jgi:hypothetical protein
MAMELIQKVTGSGAALQFTNIPATYKDLRLIIQVKADGVARSPIVIEINGDTTNTNYLQFDWYQEDNSNGAEMTTSTDKTRMVGGAAGTTTASQYSYGANELRINGYANSTIWQTLHSSIIHWQATNSWDNWGNGNTWKNNAAITSLTFRTYTGANFVAGSYISLYGIK